MVNEIIPPFSARNRGAAAQIDNQCPESTRIGLLYLVRQLIEVKYVEGWKEVKTELQRIARVLPEADPAYDPSPQELLLALAWDKVLDFCERLYSHLAREVSYYDHDLESSVVVTPKSEVQGFITGELQRLFLEENLAFEFSGGVVRRRGRRHTATQIARAELALGDPRFSAARAHYNKALKFFRNVQPDYENVVKEAVCAVEAVARVLFPGKGKTLGEVVKSVTGSESGQLPKAIANTFHGLYGFRNSGDGVGHGGADGGAVTKEIAEYALAVAASQIVFLADLAATLESDVPF